MDDVEQAEGDFLGLLPGREINRDLIWDDRLEWPYQDGFLGHDAVASLEEKELFHRCGDRRLHMHAGIAHQTVADDAAILAVAALETSQHPEVTVLPP